MCSSALRSEPPTPLAPGFPAAWRLLDALEGVTLRDTYRLHAPIGRGGMSVVYEAEHLRLGHVVAVKLMAPALVADSRALERFRREAELLVQLRHPHVVQVIDYDAAPSGEPYIVMERLEGELLAELIDRSGPVPLGTTVRIVSQLASALSHAHVRGVLHRDLKPTNVMLERLGSAGFHAKLLDFGIAKRLRAEPGLTQDGMVGTPEYMAPEQALPAARIDHRADQYALALCAYEMLSGTHPFWHDDVHEVLELVRSQSRPRLIELAPHVPPDVAAVVERAMSREPAARYPSVATFASALRRARRASSAGDAETLLARLGGPRARVRRRATDADAPPSDLTPRDVFVLSRVEFEMTLDDLVDVAALPRLEALRTVGRLLARGLLALA